ncbi:hypothetical protein A2348_00590 [Candidatus Uhrbacteria bacterium RIFOXYB12_FULL_58_10]|nr:MAG: hypothetical protein A2348_00590 [Candidatus Uhrbacteria bacterium RIFOXYB12_FULL_58_10]
MSRKGGIIWFVLFAGLVTGWWLWTMFSGSGDSWAGDTLGLIRSIPFLVSGSYLLWVAWRCRAHACADRIALFLIGIYGVLYGAALASWTFARICGIGDSVGLGVSGLLLTAAMPILAGGVAYLVLHASRTNPLSSRATLLRVFLVVFAALLVAVFGILLVSRSSYVYLAFNQLHIALGLIACFFAILSLRPGRHSIPPSFIRFLIPSIILLTCASVVYGFRTIYEVYAVGGISDMLFLHAGLVLLFACRYLSGELPPHADIASPPLRSRARIEILIPVLTAIFGLFIASFFSWYMYRDATHVVETEIRSDLSAAFAALRLSIDQQLTRVSSVAGFLAGSEFVEPSEFNEFAKFVLYPNAVLTHIGFIDTNGDLVLRDAPEAFSWLDQDVFQTLSDQMNQGSSDAALRLVEGEGGDRFLISFRGVSRDGKPLGIAIASIRTDDLVKTIPGPYLEGLSFCSVILGDDDVCLVDRDEDETSILQAATSTGGSIKSVESMYGFNVVFWGGPQATSIARAYSISIIVFMILSSALLALAGIFYLVISQRSRLRVELALKSQTLNTFVSLVAHQLRAPMTQLRWTAEQLASVKRLSRDVRETVGHIQKIATEEARLVEDLLNVSRIERGILVVEPKHVSARDLIDESMEPLRVLANERDVEIHVDAEKKTVLVSVDRQKAVEALRNILDNAIKFSPHGGLVRLSLSEVTPSHVILAIEDHGHGIPKEMRATLFDIRIEKTSSDRNGNGGNGNGRTSTGLGLYLTKRFLEAMGGAVNFKTGGEGTTFFVRLPRARSRRIASARPKR